MDAEAARVLIVEDDPGLRTLLSEYLEASGFETHAEGRGDAAVARIAEVSPDVVILDLMLPGLNGLEICRRARRTYNGGILMLTASKAEADQMLGLETGADDYVLKPVEPRLLTARLRALLRRVRPAQTEPRKVFEVGALKADRGQREAWLDGQRLELTSAEFDVLCVLMPMAGEVVSRDDLHRQVRGVEYNGYDRSIDISVSRLRRKLRALGLHDCIKSVRGAGYLLVKA